MTKQVFAADGDLRTVIEYTVSENPVYSKKDYNGLPHKTVSTNVFDFLRNLRDGYAVNAVTGGRLRQKDFKSAQFVGMDFDDLEIDIYSLERELRLMGLLPTIIHTSFSDGLERHKDGNPIRKYHCYWVFSEPLDIDRKSLYTAYLMKRLETLNPDGHLSNCVQWMGGMWTSAERKLTRRQKRKGSRINAVVLNQEKVDSMIVEDDFRYEGVTAYSGKEEGCWRGKPRNLRLPIDIEYDEFHTYRFRNGESEVNNIVERKADGKIGIKKLKDGERRRKTLFSVCCRFRINGGNGNGTRAGYGELYYNLKGWAMLNITFGNNVDDDCLKAIAKRVAEIPFDKLRGSAKCGHKVNMKEVKRMNAERKGMGMERIHPNRLISLSDHSELDYKVLDLLKGHYTEKRGNMMAMLKNNGVDITEREFDGVRRRHKEMFPKITHNDIREMLEECDGFGVPECLAHLNEAYGVSICEKTLRKIMRGE